MLIELLDDDKLDRLLLVTLLLLVLIELLDELLLDWLDGLLLELLLLLLLDSSSSCRPRTTIEYVMSCVPLQLTTIRCTLASRTSKPASAG